MDDTIREAIVEDVRKAIQTGEVYLNGSPFNDPASDDEAFITYVLSEADPARTVQIEITMFKKAAVEAGS